MTSVIPPRSSGSDIHHVMSINDLLAQVGDDGGLEEVAIATNGTAAGDHVGVRRCTIDQPADVCQLVGVVDRPVEHVFVVGRASHPEIAGMNQHNDAVGEAAVDMVVGQIHRNESGIPAFPRATLIGASSPPCS